MKVFVVTGLMYQWAEVCNKSLQDSIYIVEYFLGAQWTKYFVVPNCSHIEIDPGDPEGVAERKIHVLCGSQHVGLSYFVTTVKFCIL